MKLIRTAIIIFSLLIALATSGSPAVQSDIHANLRDSSLSQLEQRANSIDSELSQLARFSLRSGIGSIGYRSRLYKESEHREWVQVELGGEEPIDEIVIVPCVWRDHKSGFQADAFPLAFRILAGTKEDLQGTEVASFGPQDGLLPRIAPLVVPCSITASWVRVEATALSPEGWGEGYSLDLAELLVFQGPQNIALHKTVHTSSGGKQEVGPRKSVFLVDGFMPYLMHAAQGEKSVAFVGRSKLNEPQVLHLDLGSVIPLDRIHLHAVELSDTVPQTTQTGFGVPERLLIEGATRPDFSDAVRLVDYRKTSPIATGPIIIWNLPEARCRYLRLTAVEPHTYKYKNVVYARMGAFHFCSGYIINFQEIG